jgi:hypothetical protein
MTPKTPLRLAALLTAASSIAATQSPRTTPPQGRGAAESTPVIEVYKTPTCGCCSKWIDHIRAAKFQVKALDVPQSELDKINAKHGLPATLKSCHTGLVGGYVIEGHIPADQVKRLLKEKPPVAGIAVPGMPTGSPGMEIPGVTGAEYNVFSFDKQGRLKIYSTVKP